MENWQSEQAGQDIIAIRNLKDNGMPDLKKIVSRVVRKVNKTVSSWFFIDQWVILISPGLEMDVLNWPDFTPLIPPPDRYWADPFILQRNELYYVFIEEKIYETKLGHIACLVLDSNGMILSSQKVLQKPYHLSYPFLFEYDGQLYMMPESAQNRSLDVYRCVHFPDQWEHARTLMQDVYVVDATLFEYDGKWWLFANIKMHEASSSLDSLFLYYADSPISSNWTPHPMNPIVVDIHTARPAGWIFKHQGNLYRPSQDNSVRYGYALNFNRITKLDQTEYEEVLELRFAPTRKKGILATHTFSKTAGLTVIDAVIRRRKGQE